MSAIHKILIADDEPNIVISLEYLLKREGYEVLVIEAGPYLPSTAITPAAPRKGS